MNVNCKQILVIIPIFTFISSANEVRHCGADAWLMNISEDTLCLNPELVKAEIEKYCEKRKGGLYNKETNQRLVAFMPVYTLGNTSDMKAFRAIADE